MPEETAAAPAPAESFTEAMERLGGFDDATDTEGAPADPDTEESAPAAKTVAKPATGKKVTAQSDVKDLAELEAIAKKFGFALDAGQVTRKERAEFRDWKRRQESILQSETSRARAEFEKERAGHGEKLTKAERILKALEDGDPDGFAKAASFDDWNKLQESFIARLADPNYKRVRELEQKEEARERAAAEAKKNEERTSAQREQARKQGEYIQGLSATMVESQDPVVKLMGDDPAFINAVFRIQTANWDGTGTVTPEQAVNMAAPGARFTLREELKSMYQRLHKAFAGETEQKKPAPKPAPKTGIVPKGSEAEPSVGKKPSEMSRREYDRYFADRMGEASRLDALEERRKKTG